MISNPSPPFKHIQTMVFTSFLNEILGPFHPETNPLLVDEKSAPRKDITNSRGNSAAFNSSVNFGLMSCAWADGEAWSRENKSRHFVLIIVHLKGDMYNVQLFSSKNRWFTKNSILHIFTDFYLSLPPWFAQCLVYVIEFSKSILK